MSHWSGQLMYGQYVVFIFLQVIIKPDSVEIPTTKTIKYRNNMEHNCNGIPCLHSETGSRAIACVRVRAHVCSFKWCYLQIPNHYDGNVWIFFVAYLLSSHFYCFAKWFFCLVVTFNFCSNSFWTRHFVYVAASSLFIFSFIFVHLIIFISVLCCNKWGKVCIMYADNEKNRPILIF